MSRPAAGRLALDEMFSPAIAAALRELGHDVARPCPPAGGSAAGWIPGQLPTATPSYMAA